MSKSEYDVLASHLESFFTTCQTHKTSTGLTGRIEAARLQAISEYDCETAAKIAAKKEPNIFLPLTALKLRAQVSWLNDTIMNSRDKLWELESDAVPELSKQSEGRAFRELVRELTKALQQGLSFEEFDRLGENIILTEVKFLRDEAEAHLEPMTALITDQLQEGGFKTVFQEILVDLYTTFGILKGPVLELDRQLVYGQGPTPRPKDVEVLKAKRVDPMNFFPAPDVGSDTNKGTGVFEFVRWSKPDLIAAMKVKGYLEDEIRDLLMDNPDGVRKHLTEDDVLQQYDNVDVDTNKVQDLAAGTYDGVEYHGLVDNFRLKDWGIEYKGDDEYGMTEVVAMVCDGRTIYYRLNSDPLNLRPYMVCPFYPRAGSYAGDEFSTEMISPHQKIVNAVTRNMILNMAYASGPIGEYDIDRIPVGRDVAQLMPRYLYQVETGAHGERAYRFTDLPSHSTEFLNILQYFFNQTDDFTIPSYVYGAPGGGGSGAASTLGGLTMLFNNAAKSIQAVLDNIGRFWIEPYIRRLYMHNMVHAKDDEVKGPANVVVKGLAGLLQREFKRSLILQGLNLIAPFMQQLPDDIKSEHVVGLLRSAFETMGLDPDAAAKDPDRPGELQELVGTAPGTPEVQLDGRSIATPGPV